MINKIVFALYRKFCSEHYKKHIELEIEYEKVVRELKSKGHKDEYIKVFDAVKRDKAEILGIERNRAGEYVIVCKLIVKSSIWILLYGPGYTDVSRLPKIMAEVEKDRSSGKSYMHIEDILMVDDNIGNGSICMRYFLQEAKQLGVEEIRGILSLVDADHFDRSIHYYEKHGFSIEMDSDSKSGRIRYVFADLQ